MPTILLQEIRDLLDGFITAWRTIINTILLHISNIDENVEDIKDTTASIDAHAYNIEDYTDDINVNVNAIKTDIEQTIIPTVNSIKVNTDKLPDIDTKAGNILTGLNTLNTTATAINNNTGSIVSPVTRIDTNVSAMKIKVDDLASDVSDINQYIPVISANAGESATYTQATATNTLNTYNKVTMISEDTTQLRADNQVIIGLLQNQTVIHNDNIAIINLLTDILSELRGTQT